MICGACDSETTVLNDMAAPTSSSTTAEVTPARPSTSGSSEKRIVRSTNSEMNSA